MHPRRIAAQVVFSRQLFVQATPSVDGYVVRELRRALSSRLDQACLYGTGPANFQPLGVLNTANVNNVPFPAAAVGVPGKLGLGSNLNLQHYASSSSGVPTKIQTLCRDHCGSTWHMIATLCSTEESNAGGFQYPAVNAAIGRFERRLKIDRDLQEKLKKIAK